MSGSEPLRELHDRYVWRMNAALGEGRLDVVSELADEYVDEAWELLADAEPAPFGPDGARHDGPVRAVGATRRRRWRRHARRRGTS
jgi:hypothetical protein